jgi:hypothetical protein
MAPAEAGHLMQPGAAAPRLSQFVTDFQPVWISTTEQLTRLAASYRSASLLGKVLGRFSFPEGTAHARGIVIPWMRAPLALLAEGRLTVYERGIAFAATPFRVPGSLVRGVDDDLRAELGRAEVTAVEPAPFASPFARHFDIPFTRIRTKRQGLLGDFLVCVGGRLSMGRIRSRSLELQQSLRCLMETEANALRDQ